MACFRKHSKGLRTLKTPSRQPRDREGEGGAHKMLPRTIREPQRSLDYLGALMLLKLTILYYH